MNNETPNPVPAPDASRYDKKAEKKLRKANKPRGRGKRVLVGSGIFLVGLTFGGAIFGGAQEPEIVTKEVETIVEKEVEKEVEVEVVIEKTPKSCIDALNRSEDINEINVQVHDYNASSFGAVADMNYQLINSNTEKINGLLPDFENLVAAYNVDSLACRLTE